MTPEQFIDLLEKLIGKQLQKKMFHLGKIASIDGDRASVYIDGSTIPTPNVPYNPNIKFNAGEEVWVVFINFDPNDKFILCKRGTEPPDPPPSGDGQMQMHGNEWHTIAFETVAGAQEKVDTHADSKSTHGVGSNYIAKTTNPNQWPLWTEIENKPSEFPPESHNHNLADLAEKSYNSLTDKPTIPSKPEDIGAEPAFEKKTAFNKDFGTTEGTVTEGNDPRLSDAREPLPHEHTKSDITDFDHDHNDIYYTKLQLDNVLNNKADLDSNSKVPLSQLPDVTKQQTYVVPTIADRDNLTNLIKGEKCYVTNDGDSYIWDGSQWLILAQADWENVNLEWVNINNRPSSSVSNIDDAVNKRHTHNNKNVLDSITQTSIDNWNNKQDAIEGLPQVYSSENSDKFLLYRPSTGDYRSITKEDLLSGLGGTDEYIFRVKRQEFTTTEGQTIFTIDGQYLPNNNRISVYVWGNRQPNTAYEETNSNTITLIDELPAGTKVIIEWFEVVNVMDYIHAESHATDGTDPITPEMIGAVPVVEGKGLSTEDYTTAEKNKLAGIEDGANKYVHPSTHPASMITETSSKRFVSDTEKANWNAKETPSGAQAKADAALNSAKQYTDQEVAEVSQALDAHKAAAAPHSGHETPAGAQAKVDAHANRTDNPHSVTKSQVGLGNVENYEVATQKDAEEGTATNKYMTPQRTKQAIDSLQAVKSVAGKTGIVTLSKSDVGLSNVDNVQQASKAEFDSHNQDFTRHITEEERTAWNNKTNLTLGETSSTAYRGDRGKIAYNHSLTIGNPHQTTKADIGLGNVENYGIATQAEAEAGSVNNKYMTPLRVKQAIDVLQAVKSVAGKTGHVTLTKGDVGLSNVDNVKQASKTEFDSHNNDTTRHITTEERTRWNNKAEVSQIPTKVSELENDANYVTQEELGNAGYGDMMKAVYDTNDDGIVDVAETVIGNEIQLGSYKLVYNSTTNSLDIEVVA